MANRYERAAYDDIHHRLRKAHIQAQWGSDYWFGGSAASDNIRLELQRLMRWPLGPAVRDRAKAICMARAWDERRDV